MEHDESAQVGSAEVFEVVAEDIVVAYLGRGSLRMSAFKGRLLFSKFILVSSSMAYPAIMLLSKWISLTLQLL